MKSGPTGLHNLQRVPGICVKTRTLAIYEFVPGFPENIKEHCGEEPS